MAACMEGRGRGGIDGLIEGGGMDKYIGGLMDGQRDA